MNSASEQNVVAFLAYLQKQQKCLKREQSGLNFARKTTKTWEWKEGKMTAYLTRVSRPLLSLSIFLFPVFGSTPSCPVLYLPCPCSDREIHTWRTLSVGYCMFTSRHQHIHSVPHCDSHLSFCLFWALSSFPNASYDRGYTWKMDVVQPVLTWLKS